MWKQRQAAWLFYHLGIDASALLFADEVKDGTFGCLSLGHFGGLDEVILILTIACTSIIKICSSHKLTNFLQHYQLGLVCNGVWFPNPGFRAV